VALLFALPACKRSIRVSKARPADVTNASPRGVLCVEQPDACLYCVGAREGGLLETSSPASSCATQEIRGMCGVLLHRLAPTLCLDHGHLTALTFWILSWPSIGRCSTRDTADRPEVAFSGRVTDETGHRLEGVHVDIWVARGTQFTSLGDGSFDQGRHLQASPCAMVPGPIPFGCSDRLASEIVDRLAPDKLAASSAAPARIFAWAQIGGTGARGRRRNRPLRWRMRCYKPCATRRPS